MTNCSGRGLHLTSKWKRGPLEGIAARSSRKIGLSCNSCSHNVDLDISCFTSQKSPHVVTQIE